MMKKIVFAVCSFAFAVIFAACTENPTVVGKWKSDPKVDKEKDMNVSMEMDLNLAEDKTMALDINALMDAESEETSMHMPFKMGFKGKWEASDKKMVWNATDSSQYVKFEKDSVKITFKNPELEALGDKLLKSFIENFEKELAPNMLSSFEKTDSMDYTLEGDVLKIVSAKDTIVFHRQK